MTDQTLTLRITLVAPPANTFFSLQDNHDALIDLRVSDGGDLTFDVPVRFVEDAKGVRFLGPFVRNQGGRRFVYYCSGVVAGQAHPTLSRRGKIWFEDLPVELAREAAVSGRVLHATFPGKAKDGGASCATVRPLERWRLLAPGA